MTTTLQLVDPDLLRRRARTARAALGACRMCEHRCGVDRRAGAPAPCGLDAETWCFKRHVSLAEEPELLPSYMVYLGGCNFRCRFCVQAPSCFDPKRGSRVDPAEAAADFRRAVDRGARSINLLGGEPSLHPHAILEVAAEAVEAGDPLPLVLNSNMYMTPEVLELLDGVVALYIADFKFGNDDCARRLADVERYMEVVTRNLGVAAARTPIIVRHLLMPSHLDCCFRPVAEWLAANLPDARFHLMRGYVPAARAESAPALGRCLTERERAEAVRYATELGLGGEALRMVSENAGDGRDDRGADLEITIRIGPDGRLYFNDVTVDLLPVALAMAPGDPGLRRCAEAVRHLGSPVR